MTLLDLGDYILPARSQKDEGKRTDKTFISLHALTYKLSKVFKDLSSSVSPSWLQMQRNSTPQLCLCSLNQSESESMECTEGLQWTWAVLEHHWAEPMQRNDQRQGHQASACSIRESRLLKLQKLLAYRENQVRALHSWSSAAGQGHPFSLGKWSQTGFFKSVHMILNHFKKYSLVPKHGWSKPKYRGKKIPSLPPTCSREWLLSVNSGRKITIMKGKERAWWAYNIKLKINLY